MDSLGKILERILCVRMDQAIEGSGGLAEHQYGFRKERSTLDAAGLVIDTARTAIKGDRWKGGTKKYCAIVTLDVKNAFNSAKWSKIHEALQKLNVPLYIRTKIGRAHV